MIFIICTSKQKGLAMHSELNFKAFAQTTLVVSTLGFSLVTASNAAGIAGQGTWETTLWGRNINLEAVSATSADAVYLFDTTLNVTWLRDASAGGVSKTWSNANSWAENLVTGSGLSSISDWRLPVMLTATPNPALSNDGSTDSGFNVPVTSSELASLFFRTLGNKSGLDINSQSQSGAGLTNTGSFQNFSYLQSYQGSYWLGTSVASNPSRAWLFNVNNGSQYSSVKTSQTYALAVRSGDVISVSAVPEPSTCAMLLLGVGLVLRRATKNQRDKTFASA